MRRATSSSSDQTAQVYIPSIPARMVGSPAASLSPRGAAGGAPSSSSSSDTVSMYDRMWHPDLTEAEALEMMRLGIEEVKNRLVVASPTYTVKIVDENGIRTIPL